MRRFKQQLTEERCREVLADGRRGTLAVSGDDGYPYAVPINYCYDAEKNRIYFHGALEGHKLDAIRRCSKVSFNVLSEGVKRDGAWWLEFDSVTIFGKMHEITDSREREYAIRSIGRKYYPDEASADAAWEKYGVNCLALELVPDLMTGKHVNEK